MNFPNPVKKELQYFYQTGESAVGILVTFESIQGIICTSQTGMEQGMKPSLFCLKLIQALMELHWGPGLSGLAREGNKCGIVNEAECE